MNSETLLHRFDATVTQWQSKKAITFLRNGNKETALTYSQLWNDINQFAHFLLDRGIKKGNRIILLIEKSLISVVAHFAVQRLGAVSIPLNPGFKKNELSYLLTDAEPALIISSSEKAALTKTIRPGVQALEISTELPYQQIDFFRQYPKTPPTEALNPEDPGLIIYTSGTTGNPKGAVLTQKNLLNDADNIIKIWEISKNDVLSHALPLFHVHGLCFALHTALITGAHVRLLDQFEPGTVLAELSGNTEEAPCTVFMAVPTMYTKLMDHIGDEIYDFSHLRLLTSGSAPLLVSAFDRIHKIFGKKPVEREGMSETGMNFSNPIAGEQKPGAIGLPLPGVTVRIVDPKTLRDVSPGDIGELWLKSQSITPGYWRKPRETEATFHSGWFKTGDLGKMDRDGYFYLTDRIKHIIITGGENVSAKEVETVINGIDGVIESSVVGLPDEKWGEKVVAAVTVKPKSKVTEAQIQAVCKKNLHDWKCPKKIIFIDKIPKNTMGKMLKEVVKEYFVQC